MSLRPQRHEHEWRRGANLLRARSHGAGQGCGCGLRLVPGLDSRCSRGSPAGQGRPRPRRRRPHHAERPRVRTPCGFHDVVAGWPVQGLRRLRQRLRARRRVRGRRVEAPERSASRRRPHLGGDSRCRGQPRRGQRRIDGAQHSGARAGYRSRALPGGPLAGEGGLSRGSRDRNHGGRSYRDDRCGRGLWAGA